MALLTPVFASMVSASTGDTSVDSNTSKCSLVIRGRCKAFPRDNRTRMLGSKCLQMQSVFRPNRKHMKRQRIPISLHSNDVDFQISGDAASTVAPVAQCKRLRQHDKTVADKEDDKFFGGLPLTTFMAPRAS